MAVSRVEIFLSHRWNNLAGFLITLQTRDDEHPLLAKTLTQEGISLRYTAWDKTYCLAAMHLF